MSLLFILFLYAFDVDCSEKDDETKQKSRIDRNSSNRKKKREEKVNEEDDLQLENKQIFDQSQQQLRDRETHDER